MQREVRTSTGGSASGLVPRPPGAVPRRPTRRVQRCPGDVHDGSSFASLSLRDRRLMRPPSDAESIATAMLASVFLSRLDGDALPALRLAIVEEGFVPAARGRPLDGAHLPEVRGARHIDLEHHAGDELGGRIEPFHAGSSAARRCCGHVMSASRCGLKEDASGLIVEGSRITATRGRDDTTPPSAEARAPCLARAAPACRCC